MNSSIMLPRQGHRLLQVGVGLILLSSLEGFALPYMATPRLGLTAHTLSALQAALVIGLGLVWPRLTLGETTAQVAFWFLVYAVFAIFTAYVLASVWGAGGETMRLGTTAVGSVFQETTIKTLAFSSVPTGFIAFALVFWGLRGVPA